METQSRRKFIKTAGTGAFFVLSATNVPYAFSRGVSDKLALLGGSPVRGSGFPGWPVWDKNDEEAILPVLRSGVWSRAGVVSRAEEKFARAMGTQYCLLTTNGTHALITSLRALGIEGGDEVITTPYTFVATVDAICLNNALPVFVDIDPATWQMDVSKIEAAITPETKVLLPVHILGGLCHMRSAPCRMERQESRCSWRPWLFQSSKREAADLWRRGSHHRQRRKGHGPLPVVP